MHTCSCGSCTVPLSPTTFWNMQSIPVCDRGSLWAGRSLTASVGEQVEDGKCALSPGHCTDTLLVSAASQAERAIGAEENGQGGRGREFFCSCSECMMGSRAGRLECVCHPVWGKSLFFFFLLLALEKKSVKCRQNVKTQCGRQSELALRRPRLRKLLHFTQREFTGRRV